jgi:hypothetical protein
MTGELKLSYLEKTGTYIGLDLKEKK